MLSKSLEETQKCFLKLIEEIDELRGLKSNTNIMSYIQQNLSILNHMLAISMHGLKKIKFSQSKDEIMNIQLKLIKDIKKKIIKPNQNHSDVSINCNAQDKWSSHCALSTD